MNNTTFEDRCAKDPQGVIDDLVKQTTTQAKSLFDKNREIERLTNLLSANGIDSKSKPPEKKRGKKKETSQEECPF